MTLKAFLEKTPKLDKYSFGRFITQRREEFGMTQRELASKLEISNTYLWDIENGHRLPPTKLIKKFEEYLQIDMKEVDKFELEDFLYAARESCAPDLINYLIANKEARKTIRFLIENDISGKQLYNCVINDENIVKNQ